MKSPPVGGGSSSPAPQGPPWQLPSRGTPSFPPSLALASTSSPAAWKGGDLEPPRSPPREEGEEGPPTPPLLGGRWWPPFPAPRRPSSLVRLFLSSEPTEMGAEREALMEHAYPAVQAFCQKHGLMFEVIDLQWAPFSNATGAACAAATQLCLEEIQRCQELSLGPNFVGLLGSHYGCPQAPPTIGEEEFESLRNQPWTPQLLAQRYLKDENANPPVYALQPPPPAEGPAEAEQRLVAALRSVSSEAERQGLLSHKQRRRYLKSELHWEMEAGLFGSGTSGEEEEGQGGSIVFFREVEAPGPPRLLGGGGDGANDTLPNSEDWHLLAELKATIASTVPPERIKVHTVPPIGPHRPPAKYLRSLCDQFVAATNHLILQGLRSREGALGLRAWPSLAQELAHHAALARDGARGSCWRWGLLEQLCRRMRQDHSRDHPLLGVWGSPGSGKTALLCHLGAAMRDALGEEAVVVVRLLGTSQESASPEGLIRSLCLQTRLAMGLALPPCSQSGLLAHQFHALLRLASLQGGRPLVMLLDGLERLSGPPAATWLPKVCPPGVHLVVSGLRSEASWAPEGSCFELGPLSGEGAEEALAAALASTGRTLRPAQRSLFREAFSLGGRALSVAWAIQKARCWPSYVSPPALKVSSTAGEFAHHLCARLEEAHGSVLVAHALGYLACARFGLSDGELKDVLSLDNEVLSGILFRRSQPPPRQGVLRLPPLTWARLFRDLAPWLEERAADGFALWGFRHREFSATVEERYLSRPEERAKRHGLLADFFQGMWSLGRRRPIQIPSSSKPVSFDRKVAPQPLWFSDTCANRRKLSELPFHLLQAGRMEELQQGVLGNMSWLACRAVATGLGNMVADFAMCLAHSSCPELCLLKDAVLLLLGASGGHAEEHEIYTDMLGRLHFLALSYPRLIGSVCRQCQEWFGARPHPVLVPLGGFLDPPGGSLRKTLPAFPKGTSVMEFSLPQRRLLAGSPDGSMIVWDTDDFAVRRILTGHLAEVRWVHIFGKGRRAVSVALDGTLRLWSLDSGTEELSICGVRTRDEERSCQLDVDEKNRMVYWVSGVQVTAWHLETGIPAFCIPPEPLGAWLCAGLFAPQRMVVTVSQRGAIQLWDSVSGELQAEQGLAGLRPEDVPTVSSTVLQRSGKMVVGFSGGALLTVASDGNTWLENLPQGVRFVALSEDESLLAAGFGRRVRVFLSNRGGFCPLLDSDLLHSEEVAAAAFSVDNNTLLTTSAGDDGIWVWDLSQQGLLADVLGGGGAPTTHLALRGHTLVSASRHAPELRVWDLSCDRTHKALPPCMASGGCVGLAHDGRYACFPQARDECKVVVWDCQAGETLQTVDASAPVRCLELSEQRNLLFVGLESGAVLGFPFNSAQDVGCVPPAQNPKPITGLALNQTEDQLAIACEDRVQMVEVGQGMPGGFLLGQPAYAFETRLPGVAISSLALLSGSRVIYGMTSGQLFLYHGPQDCVVPLEGQSSGSVTCLRTSHGEKWALSGSADAPLRCLWDVAQCRWQHQMLFQKRGWFSPGILCACFSKDDRFLFTASMDQCVTVWDVSQGVLLAVQSVHTKITRMEATADGFVAATRLGYLIREKFRCPPSVSPQHDPLGNMDATCNVTSRKREEDPGGEWGSQGRAQLRRQSCGNKLSQICRIV